MLRPVLSARGLRVRAVAALLLAAALLSASAGCDGPGSGTRTVPIPVEPPEEVEPGGPFLSEGVLRVLDLQNRRDGAGLVEGLASEDPVVRARSAFALASVPGEAGREALLHRLEDPEPRVRRDAAFALGQHALPDGGDGLLSALENEHDPDVRLRLLESVGLRGEAILAERLVGVHLHDGEEGAFHLALSRLSLRLEGVVPDPVLDRILTGLDAPDPRVREHAAYYIGRAPSADPWASRADRVRDALDGLESDDPAAMHLLLGIGRLDAEADRTRLLGWLVDAGDWRIRTNAARALGLASRPPSSGLQDLFWERLEADPSDHVALAIAAVLAGTLDRSPAVLQRGHAWVRADVREWRRQWPFVERLAELGEVEVVLDWVERRGVGDPAAARAGTVLLPALGSEGARTLLRDRTEHEDPWVRSTALAGLAQGHEDAWSAAALPEEDFERLARAVRDDRPMPAARAVDALSSPVFHPFGAVTVLTEAFHVRDASGSDEEVPALISILDALARIGDPDALPVLEAGLGSDDFRIRRAAGEAHRTLTGRDVRGLGVPEPEVDLDVEFLRRLGPTPRLVLDTERGTLRIRLAPEEAPLTVQTIARLTEAGQYDGVPFHRVIGNFVAQGGDVGRGDGSGSAGFAIRTEVSRIPFRRGVIGMASSGRDTEGSQFFLTHSMQPHLDGFTSGDGGWFVYTAFGWLEEGEEALDALLEGDRILRARIETEPQADSSA